jgi:hypothetical protein
MLRTFTLLALSMCTVASASAAGTNHDIRPAHKKDARVYVTLVNKATWFRDVQIDGHTYRMLPSEMLAVKAPAGTMVYAGSDFAKYHSGDALLELTPSLDHGRVAIK